MGKAGWQVATAIFASLTALFGAVAFNSSRAVDVANAQLRAKSSPPTCPATPAPEPQVATRVPTQNEMKALYEQHRRTRAALWNEHLKAGTARCIGGTMFFKDTDGGIRSGGDC